MTDRLSCMVPHCNRTKKPTADIVDVSGVPVDMSTEWLCQDHWRMVPPRIKHLKLAAFRKLKRNGTLRDLKIAVWLWKKCKAAAIEKAMGL